MDKITALIEAAALPVILTAGIGFCVWLVKGFLTKTTEHIKELLDEKIGRIEKLLDRDRASFNEKIGHIDKQLSNHITETNDKIKELKADVKELKSGQADLAVKIAEGQAKLETKISDGQAELYKLLSLKSPDKKK